MFCSGQRGLAWCEAISWCVVFAQFSTPTMLLKEHVVCRLKAPLFSCSSPLIEQKYLWLLIFKQQGRLFLGIFLEFIWCICWKCSYPIIIVQFLILSGKAIQGNRRWKGADCRTFLKGRGVLNVTTVSLCDNMEMLTFLWFGIQSMRVTDRAKLKISPTECSWIL